LDNNYENKEVATSQVIKKQVIEENVYKIGNVSFLKIIEDYKKFEQKHKEM
jgi:hypothetical protein